MQHKNHYDVIITGGGLAGLTLALQLKQAQKKINILVLEKRSEDAPNATHKVGESISEIAAIYLREKLHLDQYLDEKQILKFGLRFYFGPQSSSDIANRVELGTRGQRFYRTHQIDRGVFENDLIGMLKNLSVTVLLGAKIQDIIIAKQNNEVQYLLNGKLIYATTNWIVDATGRSSFLKRKLGLKKEIDHQVNAAWFRINEEIDIDTWTQNAEWRNIIAHGKRRFATNHLMGKGYWIWLIPLVTGSISIGIVADPNFHAFESYNSFDKAMMWLKTHEPLAHKMIAQHQHKLLDFKVMKNFAYDTKQFFSADKWALTGEAGAFMDPLYSPGSDFIALGNTWITDLIIKDLNGTNISLNTMIYELAIKELIAGWILVYQNMYSLFGTSNIMLIKIIWDWASYWGVPCILFANDGYTNISVLKQYSSSVKIIGQRFRLLNEKMQHTFKVWGNKQQVETENFSGNLFNLNFFLQLQQELSEKHNPQQLMLKVESNLALLEKVACEMFRKISNAMNDTPIDMKINIYDMNIKDSLAVLLQKAEHPNAMPMDESIKNDIDKMWLNHLIKKAI
jgi:flavin-dependent dehydrogenase